MQTFFVVGTLAVLLATAIAAPTCDETLINTTIINCYTQNGVALQDAMRYVPGPNGGVNLTEQDLKWQCDHRDEYQKITVCIAADLTVCYPDASMMTLVPDADKQKEILNLTCNDPNLNFYCLAMVSQHKDAIQACVTAKYDFSAHLLNTTMTEVICESSKVGVDCSVQLIEKCDTHTASVVRRISELSLPPNCGAQQ